MSYSYSRLYTRVQHLQIYECARYPMESGCNCTSKFPRRTFTEEEFDRLYLEDFDKNEEVLLEKIKSFGRKIPQILRRIYCGPVTNNEKGGLCLPFLNKYFPFIGILRNYDVKNWLTNDLVTGFTVGIMHVPQGMAYAMLATLPPVYGLYCSMFASFVYFFFGASRYLSLGTIAVISLLVGGCIDRNITKFTTPETPTNPNSLRADDSAEVVNRVLLASALAMVVGIIQLGMGLLRLGFLTRLLSDPMLNGFTVGSSVHVGVSQISVIFGLSPKKATGIFNLPKNFYSICANLHNSNWVTFGLSVSFMILLYVFQLWINPPLRARIKVPIPIELVTIIIGGLISHFLQLGPRHNVKIVGDVPKGFPQPSVPQLSMIGGAVGDAFVIAIIGFALSYSLASFYAHKDGEKVDPNQELFAYGVTNITGSFFSTYPVSASISRSVLVNTMGGKTQIVGLIASVLVLFVILFAGPLFYSVPNCCLSAIILVALRGMLLQVKELSVLWRYSIWDFASWLITFLATVFLDVLYGLIIGIVFSALSIFIRSQFSKAYLIGQFEGSEVFRPSNYYTNCLADPKIKIVRYEGGLFYAGMDLFIASVIEAAGFDPRTLAGAKRKLDAVVKEADSTVVASNGSLGDSDDVQLTDARTSEATLFGQGGQNSSLAMADAIETEETQTRGSGGCACGRFCCVRGGRRSISNSKALAKKQDALNRITDLLATIPIAHLILDCSAWTFIDHLGAGALKTLLFDFNEVGVEVYLAGPSRRIHKSLLRSGLFEKMDSSIVYISVFDAYNAALQQEEQPPNQED